MRAWSRTSIEGYRVAARGLAALLRGPVAGKDLVKRTITLGERMFLAGEIARREAVSRPLLENAYASFVDQGYLARADGKLALTAVVRDLERRRDDRVAHRVEHVGGRREGLGARLGQRNGLRRDVPGCGRRGTPPLAATPEDEATLGRALRLVAGRADQGVLRRERAGRVGRAEVARQREGLAAAAAEVDLRAGRSSCTARPSTPRRGTR